MVERTRRAGCRIESFTSGSGRKVGCRAGPDPIRRIIVATDNMTSKIAFIGGIHGVGKSTVCKHICRDLKIEYLSASELLKWKDLNEDAQNKPGVKTFPPKTA